MNVDILKCMLEDMKTEHTTLREASATLKTFIDLGKIPKVTKEQCGISEHSEYDAFIERLHSRR